MRRKIKRFVSTFGTGVLVLSMIANSLMPVSVYAADDLSSKKRSLTRAGIFEESVLPAADIFEIQELTGSNMSEEAKLTGSNMSEEAKLTGADISEEPVLSWTDTDDQDDGLKLIEGYDLTA